jgi:hypothetical protein
VAGGACTRQELLAEKGQNEDCAQLRTRRWRFVSVVFFYVLILSIDKKEKKKKKKERSVVGEVDFTEFFF